MVYIVCIECFIYICMCIYKHLYIKHIKEYFIYKHYCLIAQSSMTLLRSAWDFLGKNTGMGCPFLLQAIFPA